MNIDDVLARILKLHPNKLIDLKLDRVERLLEALGRPQDRLPPTIHVAGTNGKGSTIAFMRSILEAAEHRVHVYSTPHLVNFRERIRLAGTLVTNENLLVALERCEAVNDGRPITYFELTTAAAILLFSEVEADYLLLEVGLGGRFDATNVIANPLGCVVSVIDMDHQDFLGHDLGTIAREKAGILKMGAPVVVARQHDDAFAAIEDEAMKLGVVPKWVGQDFDGYEQSGRFIYQDETGLLDLPKPALQGAFQILNATLAIGALRHFGINLSEQQIADGVSTAQWPGRMMPIRDGHLFDLLPMGSELWVDGGHNPSGGKVLAEALHDLNARMPSSMVMIWASFANKDHVGYLNNFSELNPKLIVTQIPGDRASCGSDVLVKTASDLGLDARTADTLEDAVRSAAKNGPARYVICGSLHFMGEFFAANGTELI